MFKRVIGLFDLQAIHVSIPIQTIFTYFDFNILFDIFFLHYDCFHLVLLEPDVTTFGQEDGAVENFPAEKLGTCHGSYLSITKLPLPTAYPALQSIVL